MCVKNIYLNYQLFKCITTTGYKYNMYIYLTYIIIYLFVTHVLVYHLPTCQ